MEEEHVNIQLKVNVLVSQVYESTCTILYSKNKVFKVSFSHNHYICLQITLGSLSLTRCNSSCINKTDRGDQDRNNTQATTSTVFVFPNIDLHPAGSLNSSLKQCV